MGHVLVVDDSAVNRKVASALAASLGHRVSTAADGTEALRALREADADVDVVLLDIVMPVMDGVEALVAIKGDEALRELPVVVVSAVDELAVVARCLELGAVDYLTKPIEPAILRARLASSLAQKRLRDVELDYLRQVDRVMAAAHAVEAGSYDASALDDVAGRDDALGRLARVFQQMAREVAAREDGLRRELRELRIELDRPALDRQIGAITDSDYFRRLNERAATLKSILRDDPDSPAPDESGS
jgi:CheY-like chemotaxis protein